MFDSNISYIIFTHRCKDDVMRKLLSVIIVYLVGWIPMFPCTSAVVSGRVTPDGRPLLWKHRDASDLNNRIVHFEAEGGTLEFVGLVNGVDTMCGPGIILLDSLS